MSYCYRYCYNSHTGKALNRHILSGIDVIIVTEAALMDCRVITVTVKEDDALCSRPSAVCISNIHSGPKSVSNTFSKDH